MVGSTHSAHGVPRWSVAGGIHRARVSFAPAEERSVATDHFPPLMHRMIGVAPTPSTRIAQIAPHRNGWARSACLNRQDVAGVEVGNTTFGGWVPSDLRRFLPLAVFLTWLAEMVFLPTRFFFVSAISILRSKETEDTGGADAQCLLPSH